MAAGAKAMLMARAGDLHGAVSIAADAAAATTAVPHPLYALGRTRALAGDLRGAIRALDAAIVVAPSFLASRVARAEVLLDLGDEGGARTSLDPVLAESPDDLAAQLLLAEVAAAAPATAGRADESPMCAGARWRPPAIKAACELAHAAHARRAGDRAGASAAAESAARAIPDEPRLLARAALRLANLGAVDEAAALVTRARRFAAAETPALAWATAAITLGRGREGILPAPPLPADPETALVVARATLATEGASAVDAVLESLGAAVCGGDADLNRLASFIARKAPSPGRTGGNPQADPMQAYLDGLRAQLDGDLGKAAERFGHALAGHGDACRAAGEYVAALRAQKLRPDRAVFARLRAENSHCVNLR
jgi:tetratricopeptide (TPR) repeat protein